MCLIVATLRPYAPFPSTLIVAILHSFRKISIMTDPLSVTSGAVGIVSFGPSVCQGIISYCGSWKDRDQEISSILNKAGGLRQTLQVLENFLQGDGSIDAGDGAIYADVRDKVKACNGEIEKTRQNAQEMQRKNTIEYSARETAST